MHRLWFLILLAWLILIPGQTAPFAPAATQQSPAWRGSAGVFVGISKFEEKSNLSSLRFAVDDAIALADLLVNEMPLLPPTNVWLAISPIPANNPALNRLRGQGVKIMDADFRNLRTIFETAPAAASHVDGFFITSWATHGFELDGRFCLMPTDGRSGESSGTIPVSMLESRLKTAGAKKTVMLIDACRETEFSSTRGDDKMPPAFYKAFEETKGFGVLAACSKGEKSWEAPEFAHGVFTHFVIEGLRGKASHDGKTGFVRFGDLASYVTAETQKWVDEKKGVSQKPWFSGDTSATKIPLAINPAEQEAVKQINARVAQVMPVIISLRGQFPTELSSEQFTRLTEITENAPRADVETLLAQGDRLVAAAADKREEEFRNFAAWFRGMYPAKVADTPAPVPKPIQEARNRSPVSQPVMENPAPSRTVISLQVLPVRVKTTTHFALRDHQDTLLGSLSRSLREVADVDITSKRPQPRRNSPDIPYLLTLSITEYSAPLPPRTPPNRKSTQRTITLEDLITRKPATPAAKESLTCLWNLYRTADDVELANQSVSVSIPVPEYVTKETTAQLIESLARSVAPQVNAALKSKK